MSHLPRTSQEINKAWGKSSNKFYMGRWEVRVNGYCAGKKIVMHALALKSFNEACRCPLCGSTDDPSNFSSPLVYDYTKPKYDKVTGERIGGKTVTLQELERECPNCRKWWRVLSGVGFQSNVILYNTEEPW